MGFPNRREIPVEFKKPRTEFDLNVEHRNVDGDPEQTTLGTFTVREIEPAQLAQEKVRLILTHIVHGRVSSRAYRPRSISS